MLYHKPQILLEEASAVNRENVGLGYEKWTVQL